MVESNHAGDTPRVASSAYVHASAVLIGNVVVEDRVFIGPNAVVRADESGPGGKVAAIVIEQEANVQDGVVIHALGGADVRIGRGSSLAHAAVVHGPCDVGADCFVGFNSVVFKASLAAGVIVMHQALVEGVTIPRGRLVPSMTAVRNDEDVRRLAPAPPELSEFARGVRRVNVFLAEASRVDRPTGEEVPLAADTEVLAGIRKPRRGG